MLQILNAAEKKIIDTSLSKPNTLVWLKKFLLWIWCCCKGLMGWIWCLCIGIVRPHFIWYRGLQQFNRLIQTCTKFANLTIVEGFSPLAEQNNRFVSLIFLSFINFSSVNTLRWSLRTFQITCMINLASNLNYNSINTSWIFWKVNLKHPQEPMFEHCPNHDPCPQF